MVSNLPVAVTGGLIGSGFAISRKRRSERLVNILVDKLAISGASASLVGQ